MRARLRWMDVGCRAVARRLGILCAWGLGCLGLWPGVQARGARVGRVQKPSRPSAVGDMGLLPLA
jgi:hypothetical protein